MEKILKNAIQFLKFTFINMKVGLYTCSCTRMSTFLEKNIFGILFMLNYNG